MLIDHRQCIGFHGEDLSEIRDPPWTPRAAPRRLYDRRVNGVEGHRLRGPALRGAFVLLVAVALQGCSNRSGGGADGGDKNAGPGRSVSSTIPLGESELRERVAEQIDAAKRLDAVTYRATLDRACRQRTDVHDVEELLEQSFAAGLYEWTLEIRSVEVDGTEATVTTAFLDPRGEVVPLGDGAEDTDRWFVEDGAWRTDDC